MRGLLDWGLSRLRPTSLFRRLAYPAAEAVPMIRGAAAERYSLGPGDGGTKERCPWRDRGSPRRASAAAHSDP